MIPKVKICGITSVGDARDAAAAGADAIGLMFYEPSPRRVSISQAAQIAESVPALVHRVGVFVNPDPALVREAIRQCRLSVLQFHGDEDEAFCLQFPLPSIKAIRIRDKSSLAALDDFKRVSMWLLDSRGKDARGGTGERFDWELLEGVEFARPWLLAGGLNPQNVADAVRKTRPFGVDVSSGVESALGRKDDARVLEFVVNAKTAALNHQKS